MYILKNKHMVESLNGSNIKANNLTTSKTDKMASIENSDSKQRHDSKCSGSKLDSIIRSSSEVFEAYDVATTPAKDNDLDHGMGQL